MSVLLRDAVRELLDQAAIATGADLPGFARLRHLVQLEERAAKHETALTTEADRRLANIVAVLRAFQKHSGHFIGCRADRDGGSCTDVCRQAQSALAGDTLAWADGTLAALVDTIDALDRERRSAWRIVARYEARSVKRGPGRPRKKFPPIFSSSSSPDTSGSRATRA